jgi:membrane-bound lytic murein transglycosylase MltF
MRHPRLAIAWILLAWTPLALSVPLLPRQSLPFKSELQTQARRVFGPQAPIALLAAIVETESSWNPKAHSSSGDLGLAQIGRNAHQFLNRIRPGPGRGSPRDPKWALSAMSWYLWHLREAIPDTSDERERWAMTLAAYNGGLGWVKRERALCARVPRCDSSRWFGHTERFRARGKRAFKENRHYVVKVFKRQAAYVAWK